MNWLGQVDWTQVWGRDIPFLEIFVRGTAVYLGLFLMLRLVLKRQAGTVGITDLLVVVLIADAAQNAMAGAYHSVPDGLLLVGVIIFWSYLLDWLSFRFAVVRRLIDPPPLCLVRDGAMQRQNMRRELITVDDLMAQLREQGVDDLAQVKHANMEGDGRISVITYQDDKKPSHATERRGV
jgi:uncharacterized membrane protein YcaP (DUF421 family)